MSEQQQQQLSNKEILNRIGISMSVTEALESGDAIAITKVIECLFINVLQIDNYIKSESGKKNLKFNTSRE